MSVISCHLFIATSHRFPRRRQLKKKEVDLHMHEVNTHIRIYLMSTTSFSFPIAKDIAFNLCRENFPSGKRYEVTITYYTARKG